jgi:membrane-associated phospholipid phosphatase
VSRIRLGTLPLLAVLLFPGAASGQEAVPPSDAGARKVSALPANLLRDAIGVFHVDNLRPLLIGVGATGVGAIFDDKVAEAIADPDNAFGQSLDTGGQPWISGTVIAATFAVGRLTGSPRFRAVSYDWVNAYLVNTAYSVVLKEAVGRQRPNGADSLSFPSGHASNAFALAAVAERHWGWKVGIPAYGLAGAVALSRLQMNAHYLSDVMAGATLGYIVGRTVVRVNSRPATKTGGSSVSLSPLVTRRTRAMVLHVEF